MEQLPDTCLWHELHLPMLWLPICSKERWDRIQDLWGSLEHGSVGCVYSGAPRLLGNMQMSYGANANNFQFAGYNKKTKYMLYFKNWVFLLASALSHSLSMTPFQTWSVSPLLCTKSKANCYCCYCIQEPALSLESHPPFKMFNTSLGLN